MQKQDVIFSSKHPKTTYFLAATEMCQRFAYWGVAYLLVLFLVSHFNYSPSKATSIFALYTGIAALAYLLGAYIADRWNYRGPILLGMVLTSVGCFLLSSLIPSLFIPALICVGLGGALFTPTVYSLLGSLYTKRYHIREGGFSIYYVLANIGSFIGLIVLGYIQTVSFRIAFFLAGCAPLLGLIPYYLTARQLKTLSLPRHYFISKRNDPHTFPLKRYEKERIIVLLIITLASIFFWMCYNQAGSSMTLFALNHTERVVGFSLIPVPWFTGLYALFLALLAFPLAYFYLFLRRIKSSPSPPMRTALSLFFMGLCFMVMHRAAAQVYAPAYNLVIAFALMSLAELFLTPLILSLVTSLSPHRYRGILAGCWFICMGVGLYLGGYLAGWMETMGISSFFNFFAFLACVPAIIIVLFSKKLDAMRHIDSL